MHWERPALRNLLAAGLLLLSGFGLAVADDAPVNYTIHFNATSGTAPTSGSFTYDSVTEEFSNFLVEWEGRSFDLTSAANNPHMFRAPACLAGKTGPAATFKALRGCSAIGAWSGDLNIPLPGSLYFIIYIQEYDPAANLKIASDQGTRRGGALLEETLGEGLWFIAPQGEASEAAREMSARDR